MNASASVSLHTVVSEEEWLAARRELLKQEKELTRQQQRVAAARRGLPWVKVTRDYVFDAPGGTRRLADLFAGRSQLIVKHNMLNPTNDVCIGCSLEMDAIEGARVHLEHHDVSIVAVSRAPGREDRRGAAAHRLDHTVGVLPPQRLQLRLPCLLQA